MSNLERSSKTHSNQTRETETTTKQLKIPKNHTEKTLEINLTPIAIAALAGIAIYWSSFLGYNTKKAHYEPVRMTKNSQFIGDSKNGSEFIVPRAESDSFDCGKAILKWRKDRTFSKDIQIIPTEPNVHITCEGTNQYTPFKEYKDDVPRLSPWDYDSPGVVVPS